MAVNRMQVRSLLMPGMHKWGGHRGIAFTDDEIEAVVDAYCTDGIDAAVRVGKAFVALPLVSQAKQKHLARLRSVSPAYKQAQIPFHLRNTENAHALRQRAEEAARRAAQASYPGGYGGPVPGGLTIIPTGSI